MWFTDRTSKPLEVEDKINLTLIITWYGQNAIPIEYNSHCIKMRYSIEPRDKRLWIFIFC